MTTNSLLSLESTADLHHLKWHDFSDRFLTEEELRHLFTLCNATWQHSGKLDQAHVELTTGLCSDSLIDTLRVLRFANVCMLLAEQSVRKLRQTYDGPVDWVVGSDHAAATFSFAVASFLNAQHDFTEKGPHKTQIWKRFTIQPNEVVLQAEELINTNATVLRVQDALAEGNSSPITYAPVIIGLINRSSQDTIGDTKIISLLNEPIWISDPKECHLCAAGSPRVRAKQHWEMLTGKK